MLSIVKKLIKILGGRIELKSIVGQGSSFSFKLAFKISELPVEFKTTKKIDYDSKLVNKKINSW